LNCKITGLKIPRQPAYAGFLNTCLLKPAYAGTNRWRKACKPIFQRTFFNSLYKNIVKKDIKKPPNGGFLMYSENY